MISPSISIIAFLAITANATPMELIGRQLEGSCKKITFLFARGSTEMGSSTGYMGQTVGPAFRKALQTKFGVNEVNAQGINYSADIAGAITGGMSPTSSAGSKNMANLAKDVINQCAGKTNVVLSGYSQGAEQVHGALQILGPLGAKVAAAVTFGDPMKWALNVPGYGWGSLPKERALLFCNTGDGVCGGAFSISVAHLSYTSNGDIQKGTDFVSQIVNGGRVGESASEASTAAGPNPVVDGKGKGAGGKGASGKGAGGKGAGGKGAGGM